MTRYLSVLAAFALAVAPVLAEEADATPPDTATETPTAPAGEGAGGEGETPAVDPNALNENGLTEGQQEFWDSFTADEGVAIAESEAQAEAWYLQARALLQKGRFVEAKDAIDKAIAAFPYHQEAQKLRLQIEAILGRREDKLGQAAEWLASIGAVSQQEKAIEMARVLERGDKNMHAGNFKDAFLDYDRVAIGISAFPYQFDWGSLPSEVDAKKMAAQAKARERQINRDKHDRTIAKERSNERREMEEDILKQKVNVILGRAQEAFKRKLYRRAAADAYNAYELDRRREDARALYLEARRLSHVQFDDDYREERLERLARVNEEIHKMLIPQTELLVFPEDWFRRSLRTADNLTEDEDEEWRRGIENKLQQEVTFIWEENSLEEVIDFLRRTTGVNYVVAPEAFTDPDIPPISLSGTMRLATVLDWITELTDLKKSIRNEAIYFSSEDVQGDMTVKLYNITDLITPVTNFPGPELAYNAADGGGGGFDLFGGGGGGGEEGESITADDVQDMIQNSVAPDSWDVEGAAITFREGSKTLFITQTPEVHREVHSLLTHLRNQSSLEVHAQIRVLDVRKSFIEEIGIEWNDVQPADVLSNPLSNQGIFDVNPEWMYGASTRNFLPANASTNGFANTFGQGFRMRWIHTNNASNLFDLRTINGVLEAMEQESDVQTLNAPELTAFNGQRANATFIRQFAYISDYDVGGGGNPDPVIDVINYGDIIDLKPLVSADRKYVTLEVRPSSVLLQEVFTENIAFVTNQNNVALLTTFPLELPNVEVRTMRSTVTLPDKGSLLVGGYVRGLRQRVHSGIPFLSHIPFLGRLFSKNGIYDENRHLFYLVSVEILDMHEQESLQ